MKRPWLLAEVSLADLRETKVEVAVLPMGACEPHGLHLPYGTDTYEVMAIGEEACRKAYEKGARVILLPPIPYGVDANLLSFPMTIHIQQKNLNALVTDIVSSLEAHSVRKLVILNGHGGNEFRGGLRDLYGRTSLWVFLVEWWRIENERLKDLIEESGEHAGEVETSLCLKIVPELVTLERADAQRVREFRFQGLRDGWIWTTRPWERLTTASGYGDPRKATKEKGEAILQLISDEIANFLLALSQSDLDETFPFA